MTSYLYLAILIFSIAGMSTLDYRYKLAFWHNKNQTLKTLGLSILFFIIWDALGIKLGIFFHGNSNYALPLRIAPEFPIEELFFLLLLSYTTLLTWRFMGQR